MIHGYCGKILRIDLNSGMIKEQKLDEILIKKYIGGRGFGAKFLYEETGEKTNALGPENVLMFFTGPLVGTILPGSSRYGVFAKSPLTGIFGEGTVGGYLGAELKYAGYDGITITGRADKPVYLWVHDDGAELKSAEHLWGRTTHETESILKDEIDEKAKIASIGPAGEKLVRYACITADFGRQAGRTGMGAVMGSKLLKAIVVRGHGGLEVADMDALIEFSSEISGKLRENSATGETIPKLGTPFMILIMNHLGVLPTRNFTDGVFEGAEQLSGERMRKKFVIRDKACFACPVGCGKITRINSGPYAGTIVEGPEFETIYALGSQCGNDILESVAKANLLCDELGLDTISTGCVIGFAMECFEKGIITDEDTKGIDLSFGNAEAMVQVVEKIGKREGIGDILAEGVRRASEKLGGGSEKFAMHVKGLEFPGYEPRGMKGVGLAFAVAGRGACHLKACFHSYEISGRSDRFSSKEKGALLKESEDRMSIFDSLLMCKIIRGILEPKDIAKALALVTGVEWKEGELMKVGERITNLVRMYNVREGLGRADDILPKRVLTSELPRGLAMGNRIDKMELDKMLDEYYRVRGWDENGTPLDSKLRELDI